MVKTLSSSEGQGGFSHTMSYGSLPSNHELKGLLTGKTSEERRELLKEFEQGRQVEIHMQFFREQQSLKNTEKDVTSNVEYRETVSNFFQQSNSMGAQPQPLAALNSQLLQGQTSCATLTPKAQNQ